MSNSTNAVKAAFLLVLLVGLIAWTLFGYGVIIAAMFATSGLLQVLLGVYLVGSLLLFAGTLFVKAALKN